MNPSVYQSVLLGNMRLSEGNPNCKEHKSQHSNKFTTKRKCCTGPVKVQTWLKWCSGTSWKLSKQVSASRQHCKKSSTIKWTTDKVIQKTNQLKIVWVVEKLGDLIFSLILPTYIKGTQQANAIHIWLFHGSLNGPIPIFSAPESQMWY